MGQRGAKESTVFLVGDAEPRPTRLPPYAWANPPKLAELADLQTLAERVAALESRMAVLGLSDPTDAPNDTVAAIRRLLEQPRAPVAERVERESLENLRALCLISGLPVSGARADLAKRIAAREVDPIVVDLIEYKKEDLRAACADAGLAVSGNKFELANRLMRR